LYFPFAGLSGALVRSNHMIVESSGHAPEETTVLEAAAEDAFLAVAHSLGFLMTQEQADALSSVLAMAEASGGQEALAEAKAATGSNRVSKMDGLITHGALIIAQQKKDPLFAQYAKSSEIRSRVRQVIVKKYSAEARLTAKKILAGAGKRNMVDVTSIHNTLDHQTGPMRPAVGREPKPGTRVA
jgi:hypothetical protein